MSANKNMLKEKILIIIFAIMLFIPPVLAGCGQSSQSQPPQPQQAQTQEQGDKIPDQLKSMEDSLENIFKALNGPALVKEEEGKGKEGQQQDTGGKKEESKEQKDQGQKSEGGGQENKENQEKGQDKEKDQNKDQEKQGGENQQPPQPDPWSDCLSTAHSLHYQWNGYMPEAVRKGANKTLVDGFSSSLDNLTNAIISKNRINTLLAASSVYSHIPDFYGLYRTSVSPEIKRIRHYIRNSMLGAMTANWPQAQSDIENLKSSWSMFKNALDKDQQDNASKLDFSIYELERVIKAENQPLSDIKGRIALDNVQAIEKAAEEKQKGGGGNQQGGGQQ